MENRELIIRNITTYENELKDYIREIIKKEVELNNLTIKTKKINKLVDRINIGLLVVELLLPGKSLSIILYFIAIIIINRLLNNARVNRNNYICNILKIEKNDASNKIDSIELLKSYLRNKEITIEEKLSIIENLYLTYPEYIDPMIKEIESNNIRLNLIHSNQM
ncbi:MAG: hypothetical protein E7158_04895 [Firmicutes bacterium]|nr:hypothetical protein [Bacillota bacterium]